MWISEPVILQLDRQQSRDFDETCKDFQRCRHDNNARDAKGSNVILGLMMGLVTSLRGGHRRRMGRADVVAALRRRHLLLFRQRVCVAAAIFHEPC